RRRNGGCRPRREGEGAAPLVRADVGAGEPDPLAHGGRRHGARVRRGDPGPAPRDPVLPERALPPLPAPAQVPSPLGALRESLTLGVCPIVRRTGMLGGCPKGAR